MTACVLYCLLWLERSPKCVSYGAAKEKARLQILRTGVMEWDEKTIWWSEDVVMWVIFWVGNRFSRLKCVVGHWDNFVLHVLGNFNFVYLMPIRIHIVNHRRSQNILLVGGPSRKSIPGKFFAVLTWPRVSFGILTWPGAIFGVFDLPWGDFLT